MAEDAQKTVSQTDSRNFYGVTFTQDASTPVFKTLPFESFQLSRTSPTCTLEWVIITFL